MEQKTCSALIFYLSFLLLVSLCLTSMLLAAKESDLPSGYEAAPVASDGVNQKQAPKKETGDGLTQLGEGAIQALGEWFEKKKEKKKKVDPNVLNLERQFLPQFQKLLKAERYRVHLVCDLSSEHRRQLVHESDRLLKEVVRTYCIEENNRRRGGHRQQAGSDPQQLLRDGMARLVREQFGPDEYGRYFEANRLCRDRRQRVTVLNLVAHYDRLLMLTAVQRDRLIKNLTANWQDSWGQRLPLFMHGPQFLPKVPDSVVLPLLNKTQKTVWRGVLKNAQPVVFGQIAFGQMLGVVDEEEEVGNGQ